MVLIYLEAVADERKAPAIIGRIGPFVRITVIGDDRYRACVDREDVQHVCLSVVDETGTRENRHG